MRKNLNRTILCLLNRNFRSAQENGIWAWDSVHKELVLIFPSVLALLGDNPMHREFACHIGLRGKYFYRTCMVKGSDAQDADNMPTTRNNATPDNSPWPSVDGSDVETQEHFPPSPMAPQNSEPSTPVPIPNTIPQAAPAAASTPLTAQAHEPKRGKYQESMTAMLERVSAFIKVRQYVLISEGFWTDCYH